LSFHSDSLLFLGRKNNRRPIMAGSLRVATFYDLPGIVVILLFPLIRPFSARLWSS
jgi:hypothetical protein